MNLFQGARDISVAQLNAYHVGGNLIQQSIYLEDETLFELLQPIADASHTRDRKRSPPDSACQPGTRGGVLTSIVTWASSSVVVKRKHILWVSGPAGCGKSAISQEVSDRVHGGGRLLATFFFFRGAGDRSKIARVPNTLASQMALTLPETAPLIEAAVKAEPDLLTTQSLSLGARLRRLVYDPFKAAVGRSSIAKSLFFEPYLIVIDALDECEDKEGVEEFITSTLRFFRQYPYVPLRLFVTSRVEQHIEASLKSSEVLLKDLASFCSRNDIYAVFSAEARRNRIIQEYVRENGSWPSPSDADTLMDHIGGSFIFASALFKYIFGQDDRLTPMDRLPLALNTGLGLDAIYSQTLARAEDLPHFTAIISTIALLAKPLPIAGIAGLLGIPSHQVVHVLIELQAIVQVPGTDSDAPVTICHTSLRDYLTSKDRSGRFFANPAFHVSLFTQCVRCQLKMHQRHPEGFIRPEKQTAAVRYALENSHHHRSLASAHLMVDGLKRIVQLQREIVELHTHRSLALRALGIALRALADRTNSIGDLEQTVAVHREEVDLRLPLDPQRYESLCFLGTALHSLFRLTANISYLEEAIERHREALSRLPAPQQLDPFSRVLTAHPDRPYILNHLGTALHSRSRYSRSIPHIEEAVSRHREALSLQTSPDPRNGRTRTLNLLGDALHSLFELTKLTSHIEEAISLHRQAVNLQHPERSETLDSLGAALVALFGQTKTISTLEEAISYLREGLSLRAPSHPNRHAVLNHLGEALMCRFQDQGSEADLDEAISLIRESITQCPAQHLNRPTCLTLFHEALLSRFAVGQSLSDLEEAIIYTRELVVEHYQDGHSLRSVMLRAFVFLLQKHFDLTMNDCHLDELATFSNELEG